VTRPKCSTLELVNLLSAQETDHGCFPPNLGQIESNYDETVDSFDDMNLKAELLRGGEYKFPSWPWLLGRLKKKTKVMQGGATQISWLPAMTQ
jgi:hypothetical protein